MIGAVPSLGRRKRWGGKRCDRSRQEKTFAERVLACGGGIGVTISDAIIEANVEGGDAVGQPADRDQIDAGGGDGRCRRRRDPA